MKVIWLDLNLQSSWFVVILWLSLLSHWTHHVIVGVSSPSTCLHRFPYRSRRRGVRWALQGKSYTPHCCYSRHCTCLRSLAAVKGGPQMPMVPASTVWQPSTKMKVVQKIKRVPLKGIWRWIIKNVAAAEFYLFLEMLYLGLLRLTL